MRRRAHDMAKLSHIKDFEEKEEAGVARGEAGAAHDEAGAARGEADAQAREKAPEKAAAQAARKAAGKAAAQSAGKRGKADVPVLNTAADERDYHGLDEHSMSSGQKFIAIVSFVVLVAVVLYILNYWLHFV